MSTTTYAVKVKVVKVNSAGYNYYPADLVDANRALELARYHAAALCMNVERYEVYNDMYQHDAETLVLSSES